MTTTRHPADPSRVVLVGGGYATLHAYRVLARRLRRELSSGEVEIVVISSDDAHSFHGFTGEVLAGVLPYDVTRTRLSQALRRARIVVGEVTHVDVLARRVTYRPTGGGELCQLRYDELLVGCGGREPLGRVPGLDRAGVGLRRPGGIAEAARQIAGLGHADERSTVVVAGGGLAGVELAAAVADRGAGRVAVVLAHSGEDVVPAWSEQLPRLAAYTREQLSRLGVDVRVRTRLTAVDEAGVHLSDGSTVPADVVLATVGQRAVQLPGLESLRQDLRGRLVTDEDLWVAPGVWAAGDAALVRHPRSGDPVPANALWAIKAGAHAGRNIARTLRGRHPTRFGYRGLGQAASFGIGRGAAELYGVTFTGWTAWLLRLVFFLRFMPSRSTAVRTLGLTLVSLRRARRVRWTVPSEPATLSEGRAA
jgi:NADH dehydrogenase